MRKTGPPENRRKTGKKNPVPASASTQFQPGSGNPGGRPRTAPLSAACRELLNAPVPNDPQARTYAQVIAAKLAKKAMRGDVESARELANRAEGKRVSHSKSGLKTLLLTTPRSKDGPAARCKLTPRAGLSLIGSSPQMKKQTEQDLLRRARARGLLQHRDRDGRQATLRFSLSVAWDLLMVEKRRILNLRRRNSSSPALQRKRRRVSSAAPMNR